MKSNTVVAAFLQAGRSSCHPTNSSKALNATISQHTISRVATVWEKKKIQGLFKDFSRTFNELFQTCSAMF